MHGTTRAVLAITLLLAPGAANARIIEEVIDLPVQVVDAGGQAVRQSIKVTVFHEEGRSHSPFLILNHGRPVSRSEQEKAERYRYSQQARYFVSKGFAVLIPTRIGYGISGGPDVEYSGECRARNYPPAYEAGAQQAVSTIAYAKTLPYMDPAKGVVVGQSFGGAIAIAVAAKNVAGVLAAVNFAGGGGGNPEKRPEEPCRNDLLIKLFASYGATARIPTLWLYSENDHYWGKEKPRAWFRSFTQKGAAGKFVQLPPFDDEGHRSFTGNPSAWIPSFEEFLGSCCHF